MRMIVSLLTVTTFLSVACRDQGPERRQQAIYQIKVTPSAAVTDTVRIYIVAAAHSIPYTIRFAEPGESDSVRVVQAP